MNNTITDHINIWITAQTQKSMGRNRGIDNIHQHGVKRLRELILELAVRGKLVPQDPNDEPASVLLKKIAEEKKRLTKEGKLRQQIQIQLIKEAEKPFTLPFGWEFERFGNVVFNRDAERIPLSVEERSGRQGEYDYYGASGVIDSIDDYLFDKPLLLIGEDGANLINRSTPIAFIARDKYWVNNHAHVIDGISEEFLLYVCLHINAISLEQYVTGTAQPKMNQAKMNSIILAIPPLAEQHRIVAKVEELMALCDKLEQQQTNSNKTHQLLVETLLKILTEAKDAAELNEAWQQIESNFSLLFTTEESVVLLKQTILQLAVMGKLTQDFRKNNPALVSGANSTRELLKKIAAEKEKLVAEGKIKKQNPLPEITDDEKPFELPEGWEFVQLTNLCELITKGSSPKWQGVSYTDNQSDVLFVTSENVGSYELLLENRKYVEQKFNEIEPRSILQKGDFLMNIVGASIGRTAIYNIEEVANINQAVCLIRTIPQFLNDTFLLHFFNSDICVSYMFDKQVDNARANLSMGNISKFVIPIPPRTEQHQIVTKVDELFALCDALKERIEESQEIKVKLANEVVEAAVKDKPAGKVIYPVNEQLSLAAEPE